MNSLEILLPVYNEEKRVEKGVRESVSYLATLGIPYHVTIVDNASNDNTMALSRALERKYDAVSYLRLEKKGVGIAFREGVSNTSSDLVGYMDIDLSTDIRHLREVIASFDSDQNIDIVNGSRLARS